MSKNIKKYRHKNKVFEKFGLTFFHVTVDGVKRRAFTTDNTAQRGYNEVAYYIDEKGIIQHLRMGTQIGHDIYEIFKDE